MINKVKKFSLISIPEEIDSFRISVYSNPVGIEIMLTKQMNLQESSYFNPFEFSFRA
jgi:hypothetical protein